MVSLRLVLRVITHLTAASALILAMGAPAHAVHIIINNGLAPPNPENVIDAADDYSEDVVYVRNVGCPPGWPAAFPDDPCPSPGVATEVEVLSGGSVPALQAYDTSSLTVSGGDVGYLYAYDTSTVTMSGGDLVWLQAYDTSNVTMSDGYVKDLYAYESSTVTMSKGSVGTTLRAYDTSTVTIGGGTVGADLEAYGNSNIILIGRRFMVDGVPVPYGDLTALTGRLTGRLASRDSLDNVFYQGGYAGSFTGTITLVEAPGIPVPALGPVGLVGLVSLLLGSGLGGLAVQRRRGAG